MQNTRARKFILTTSSYEQNRTCRRRLLIFYLTNFLSVTIKTVTLPTAQDRVSNFAINPIIAKSVTANVFRLTFWSVFHYLYRTSWKNPLSLSVKFFFKKKEKKVPKSSSASRVFQTSKKVAAFNIRTTIIFHISHYNNILLIFTFRFGVDPTRDTPLHRVRVTAPDVALISQRRRPRTFYRLHYYYCYDYYHHRLSGRAPPY